MIWWQPCIISHWKEFAMSVLTENRQIGEIAAENSAAIALFEKHKIDYCCAGKRLLGEVLRERGIDLNALSAELGALESNTSGGAVSEPDWNSTPLIKLIDHILERHHAYLKRELPRLEVMMANVIERHSARHGSSLLPLRRVFQHFKQEIEAHVNKEETILFPAIEKLEAATAKGAAPPRTRFGSFSNPIRMMMIEHETASWELDEMRELTDNYTPPTDACESYRELLRRLQALETDMHLHVHLENNILFPRTTDATRSSRADHDGRG
jgi:regulator of cell morphogenesis and NO signaling